MRLFYAIEFDKEIKDFLDGVQKPIKEFSTKGNFTYIDNFHLTLRYIGEVTHSQEEKLRDILKESFADTPKFALQTDNLGSFKRGNTEIIWIGLKSNKELINLYSSLENTLDTNGFKMETRPYKPHITLGREVVLKEKSLYNYELPSMDIKVESIALMNSTRVDGRLMYVPIERMELK